MKKKSQNRNNNKDINNVIKNSNKTDINLPQFNNNENKDDEIDKKFHKSDNSFIKKKKIDNIIIEDDLQKIMKNNSIKGVVNSPLKIRKNLKIKNNYQSFRFRRHNRLNTDKGKLLYFNFKSVFSFSLPWTLPAWG